MREILILLLVLMVGRWWLRHQERTSGQRQQRRAGPPPHATQPRSLPPAEKMVQCAECGTYLPLSEALGEGHAHFCSAAHRHAYLTRQP